MVNWHCKVWNYHAYLKAEHPYASPWWSWPLLRRPVLFYSRSSGGVTRRITATGNPVLWWAGLAAVLASLGSRALRWTKARSRASLAASGQEEKAETWLLLGFFGFWLPWAFIQRVTFHYHYFLSFTLSLLLLSLWLTRLLDRPRLRPAVFFFLLTALAVFAFWYPAATALPAPWVR